MNKIFITGICGFLGSHLAHYFQSLGYKVYGVDNLSRKGSKKNLKILRNKGVKIFILDLAKSDLSRFFKKKIIFKAIIHCASLTSVLDGTNKNSTDFNILYKDIVDYLKELISTYNPSKTYVCIDGIAPISKIKQQRMRRFKSKLLYKQQSFIKKKYELKQLDWDSNCITPGTLFMIGLN